MGRKMSKGKLSRVKQNLDVLQAQLALMPDTPTIFPQGKDAGMKAFKDLYNELWYERIDPIAKSECILMAKALERAAKNGFKDISFELSSVELAKKETAYSVDHNEQRPSQNLVKTWIKEHPETVHKPLRELSQDWTQAYLTQSPIVHLLSQTEEVYYSAFINRQKPALEFMRFCRNISEVLETAHIPEALTPLQEVNDQYSKAINNDPYTPVAMQHSHEISSAYKNAQKHYDLITKINVLRKLDDDQLKALKQDRDSLNDAHGKLLSFELNRKALGEIRSNISSAYSRVEKIVNLIERVERLIETTKQTPGQQWRAELFEETLEKLGSFELSKKELRGEVSAIKHVEKFFIKQHKAQVKQAEKMSQQWERQNTPTAKTQPADEETANAVSAIAELVLPATKDLPASVIYARQTDALEIDGKSMSAAQLEGTINLLDAFSDNANYFRLPSQDDPELYITATKSAVLEQLSSHLDSMKTSLKVTDALYNKAELADVLPIIKTCLDNAHHHFSLSRTSGTARQVLRGKADLTTKNVDSVIVAIHQHLNLTIDSPQNQLLANCKKALISGKYINPTDIVQLKQLFTATNVAERLQSIKASYRALPVRNEVTKAALKEVKRFLKVLRDRPLTEDDLEQLELASLQHELNFYTEYLTLNIETHTFQSDYMDSPVLTRQWGILGISDQDAVDRALRALDEDPTNTALKAEVTSYHYGSIAKRALKVWKKIHEHPLTQRVISTIDARHGKPIYHDHAKAIFNSNNVTQVLIPSFFNGAISPEQVKEFSAEIAHSIKEHSAVVNLLPSTKETLGLYSASRKGKEDADSNDVWIEVTAETSPLQITPEMAETILEAQQDVQDDNPIYTCTQTYIEELGESLDILIEAHPMASLPRLLKSELEGITAYVTPESFSDAVKIDNTLQEIRTLYQRMKQFGVQHKAFNQTVMKDDKAIAEPTLPEVGSSASTATVELKADLSEESITVLPGMPKSASVSELEAIFDQSISSIETSISTHQKLWLSEDALNQINDAIEMIKSLPDNAQYEIVTSASRKTTEPSKKSAVIAHLENVATLAKRDMNDDTKMKIHQRAMQTIDRNLKNVQRHMQGTRPAVSNILSGKEVLTPDNVDIVIAGIHQGLNCRRASQKTAQLAEIRRSIMAGKELAREQLTSLRNTMSSGLHAIKLRETLAHYEALPESIAPAHTVERIKQSLRDLRDLPLNAKAIGTIARDRLGYELAYARLTLENPQAIYKVDFTDSDAINSFKRSLDLNTLDMRVLTDTLDKLATKPSSRSALNNLTALQAKSMIRHSIKTLTKICNTRSMLKHCSSQEREQLQLIFNHAETSVKKATDNDPMQAAMISLRDRIEDITNDDIAAFDSIEKRKALYAEVSELISDILTDYPIVYQPKRIARLSLSERSTDATIRDLNSANAVSASEDDLLNQPLSSKFKAAFERMPGYAQYVAKTLGLTEDDPRFEFLSSLTGEYEHWTNTQQSRFNDLGNAVKLVEYWEDIVATSPIDSNIQDLAQERLSACFSEAINLDAEMMHINYFEQDFSDSHQALANEHAELIEQWSSLLDNTEQLTELHSPALPSDKTEALLELIEDSCNALTSLPVAKTEALKYFHSSYDSALAEYQQMRAQIDVDLDVLLEELNTPSMHQESVGTVDIEAPPGYDIRTLLKEMPDEHRAVAEGLNLLPTDDRFQFLQLLSEDKLDWGELQAAQFKRLHAQNGLVNKWQSALDKTDDLQSKVSIADRIQACRTSDCNLDAERMHYEYFKTSSSFKDQKLAETHAKLIKNYTSLISDCEQLLSIENTIGATPNHAELLAQVKEVYDDLSNVTVDNESYLTFYQSTYSKLYLDYMTGANAINTSHNTENNTDNAKIYSELEELLNKSSQHSKEEPISKEAALAYLLEDPSEYSDSLSESSESDAKWTYPAYIRENELSACLDKVRALMSNTGETNEVEIINQTERNLNQLIKWLAQHNVISADTNAMLQNFVTTFQENCDDYLESTPSDPIKTYEALARSVTNCLNSIELLEEMNANSLDDSQITAESDETSASASYTSSDSSTDPDERDVKVGLDIIRNRLNSLLIKHPADHVFVEGFKRANTLTETMDQIDFEDKIASNAFTNAVTLIVEQVDDHVKKLQAENTNKTVGDSNAHSDFLSELNKLDADVMELWATYPGDSERQGLRDVFAGTSDLRTKIFKQGSLSAKELEETRKTINELRDQLEVVEYSATENSTSSSSSIDSDESTVSPSSHKRPLTRKDLPFNPKLRSDASSETSETSRIDAYLPSETDTASLSGGSHDTDRTRSPFLPGGRRRTLLFSDSASSETHQSTIEPITQAEFSRHVHDNLYLKHCTDIEVTSNRKKRKSPLNYDEFLVAIMKHYNDNKRYSFNLPSQALPAELHLAIEQMHLNAILVRYSSNLKGVEMLANPSGEHGDISIVQSNSFDINPSWKEQFSFSGSKGDITFAVKRSTENLDDSGQGKVTSISISSHKLNKTEIDTTATAIVLAMLAHQITPPYIRGVNDPKLAEAIVTKSYAVHHEINAFRKDMGFPSLPDPLISFSDKACNDVVGSAIKKANAKLHNKLDKKSAQELKGLEGVVSTIIERLQKAAGVDDPLLKLDDASDSESVSSRSSTKRRW